MLSAECGFGHMDPARKPASENASRTGCEAATCSSSAGASARHSVTCSSTARVGRLVCKQYDIKHGAAGARRAVRPCVDDQILRVFRPDKACDTRRRAALMARAPPTPASRRDVVQTGPSSSVAIFRPSPVIGDRYTLRNGTVPNALRSPIFDFVLRIRRPAGPFKTIRAGRPDPVTPHAL